jgi:hypothetical protein
MKTTLFQFSENKWSTHLQSQLVDNNKVQLVLCFGAKEIIKDEKVFAGVKQKFPAAEIAICSTAGEIYQETVQDNSMVAVAFQFDKTKIQTASVSINDFSNSYTAAINLVQKLPQKDLAYIMVLSDGSKVNGSELVSGLNEGKSVKILLTGGLAGDAANFKSTLVGLNEQPVEGKIVAIGFYGHNIIVNTGSKGGWDVFGLEKRITKSSNNVIFELENNNVLDLYKDYLGPEAANLPGSALLFPLSVIKPGAFKPVVRTILSIDEGQKSMTFAGDVPEGSKIRFMKANFDRLTKAASTAAEQTLVNHTSKPNFALLISCVGRKIILGSRINEEIKSVKDIFGNNTLMAGFYSYGEISPFDDEIDCQLHNQTMSITTFYES